MSGFKADVDEDYGWLAKHAFDKNPNVFPPEKFRIADFRWAVGVALSRSFFVDGELRLTPLIDFANHETSPVTLEPEGERLGCGVCQPDFGGPSSIRHCDDFVLDFWIGIYQ